MKVNKKITISAAILGGMMAGSLPGSGDLSTPFSSAFAGDKSNCGGKDGCGDKNGCDEEDDKDEDENKEGKNKCGGPGGCGQ